MSHFHTIKKDSAKKVAELFYQTTVALIDLIQESSETNAAMYRSWAKELSDHLDTLITAESPNMY